MAKCVQWDSKDAKVPAHCNAHAKYGLRSRTLRCTRCAARRRLSSTADHDTPFWFLVCRLACERGERVYYGANAACYRPPLAQSASLSENHVAVQCAACTSLACTCSTHFVVHLFAPQQHARVPSSPPRCVRIVPANSYQLRRRLPQRRVCSLLHAQLVVQGELQPALLPHDAL